MFGQNYPFYGGKPPHNNKDTSKEAAAKIKKHVSKLAAEVFQVIKTKNGLTCDEVEVELEMSHQTASARIRELVLAGRIEDSGDRRPTRSNRRATVWKVRKPPLPKKPKK